MRYTLTNGAYHSDEAVVNGTAICIKPGKSVGIRNSIADDAEPLYEGKGYAVPRFVDAPSHGPTHPREGNQLGKTRADPSVQAIRVTSNLRPNFWAGTTTIRLLGSERQIDL